MAGRTRLSSEDIERQIQALLKKKAEVVEYENRFVIVVPLINRIKDVLKSKNVELSEGELEHIIHPIRNIEKFVRDRFDKKNTKK